MSVQTYPVTWPTEASFKPLDEAFGTAYNEIEGIVDYLGEMIERDVEDFEPPTFETVGVLYNALDAIRIDLDACTRKADELERHLD